MKRTQNRLFLPESFGVPSAVNHNPWMCRRHTTIRLPTPRARTVLDTYCENLDSIDEYESNSMDDRRFG